MGLHRAGFDVIGVDIRPQPRYPFEFIQADALDFSIPAGASFVWASPPCQAYSITKKCHSNDHPELLDPVREKLIACGLPYIIENVVGAPLRNAVELNGPMFGLRTYRRRRFESNLLLLVPWSRLRRGMESRGDFVCIAGNGRSKKDTVAAWSAAMGIDWMIKRELAQAIPPAFSEYLGRQVMQSLQLERAAA